LVVQLARAAMVQRAEFEMGAGSSWIAGNKPDIQLVLGTSSVELRPF
jgi:hypothetical protein